MVQAQPDKLVSAYAGSGKTLAFLLPMVIAAKVGALKGQEGLKALVLSPTRELAEQTARALLLLVKGLRLHCCLLSTAAVVAGTDFSKVLQSWSSQCMTVINMSSACMCLSSTGRVQRSWAHLLCPVIRYIA